MKKYQLATVSSPSIEFEVGGHIIESTVISNTAKNPNFDDPLFFFDIVSFYKRNRIPISVLVYWNRKSVEFATLPIKFSIFVSITFLC